VNRTIALVFKPETRRRLYTEASGFRPVVCMTEGELEKALQARVYDQAIIGLRDARGESAAPIIARIRVSQPWLWIIGCLEVPGDRADELRLVAECAAAGADQLFINGLDSYAALYSAIGVITCGRFVAKQVLHAVGDRITGDARRFLEYGIVHAQQAVTVESITGKLNVTRQSLSRQCKRDHLPPPQVLLSWARLLVASALIAQPGRSGDHIGHRMFGSPSALRNMLRRYTGLSTSAVKAGGGLACILPLFVATVCEQRWAGRAGTSLVMVHTKTESQYEECSVV